MKNFVLEIFSEEIPPLLQQKAATGFYKIACDIFIEEGLEFDDKDLEIFVSSRRIGCFLKNIKTDHILPSIQKIGPRVDANDKAIQGFLKSQNLNDTSQLLKIENKGHQYFSYKIEERRIKSQDILQSSLNKILPRLVNIWPKLMRWNIEDKDCQPQWIRPIRNILCLLDKEVIDIEFFGLKSNNNTFIGIKNTPQKAESFDEYLNIMQKSNILINYNKRKNFIVSEIKAHCQDLDLKLIDGSESILFDEVTGLCESPQILIANIDKEFMDLPDEVLVLTLKSNQKYFCLQDQGSNLSSKFIFVIDNNDLKINKSQIIHDNERLVRARLSDAKFFINEDLKKTLDERVTDLKNIVFHQKLGSVFDKSTRLSNLAKFLAIFVPHCDLSLITRLSMLSKADLTTKAVAEFPELQGKIGSYYAHKNGEDDKIVAAIYEHYKPISVSSNLPKTSLGVVLSIADKMDAIVGLFLSGDKPTGSKDPYALRRAVLGIIRIGFYHNIAFPIRILIEKSLKAYPSKVIARYINKSQSAAYQNKHDLVADIIKFFVERLKVYLKDNDGLHPEIVNAVVSHYLSDIDAHKYCDILYISKKIRFLDKIVFNNQSQIIKLYKRVAKILQIEERNDGKIYQGKPSKMSFKTKEEIVLNKRIRQISNKFTKLIYKSDFDEAFELIKILELPLVNFFDNVTINDDDIKIRENRLTLLASARSLFEKIYGLSKVDIP